jgi:hypothetical protein
MGKLYMLCGLTIFLILAPWNDASARFDPNTAHNSQLATRINELFDSLNSHHLTFRPYTCDNAQDAIDDLESLLSALNSILTNIQNWRPATPSAIGEKRSYLTSVTGLKGTIKSLISWLENYLLECVLKDELSNLEQRSANFSRSEQRQPLRSE